jgi:hypothetical protein
MIMDQMVYDSLSGDYMRLIPSNRLPPEKLVNCPIKWFKYNGFGYRCVDGGSGKDASHCFKAYDITGR